MRDEPTIQLFKLTKKLEESILEFGETTPIERETIMRNWLAWQCRLRLPNSSLNVSFKEMMGLGTEARRRTPAAILEIIFDSFVPDNLVTGLREFTARIQAGQEDDRVTAGYKRPGMAVPRSGVPHGSFGGGPGSLEPQQKLRNTAVLDGTAGTDEGHTCLSQGMSSIAIDQSWTASQDSSLADEDQASEPETNQIVDIPLTVKRKRGRPPGKVKDGGRPPELTSGKKVSKEEKASEFLKCKQCSGLPFRPKAAAGLVIHMNNRPPGAKLTADTVKQLSQLHRAACIHCRSIRKHLDVFKCIWVYLSVFACILMYLYVFECILMCFNIFGCILVYLNVF